MIYWLQEAIQAAAQEAASSWSSAILSAGVVAAVVGLIGVLIGQLLTGRRHHQDLEQAERGQITERFTHAIDQLGSEKLEIRLGGIYALERIANDSPERDYSTIMEVLTAYVRENARRQPEETPPPSVESKEDDEASPEPENQELPTPPADVQAILTVLRRRKKAGKAGDVVLDLRATDLRGADLPVANLQGANLSLANLQGANLGGANLQGADLGGANLQGANLGGANLQEANLMTGVLDVQGGYLITFANLRWAKLWEADLRNIYNLNQEQIDEADGDETTKLPDNYQRPAHWSRWSGGED